MKKVLGIVGCGCLLALGASALLVVVVMGYTGALPPVARIMGTDQPRDLGVTTSPDDLTAAYENYRTRQIPLEPGQTLRNQLESAQPNSVDAALSESQLSALIPQLHPVTDFQFRIHDDGTVEAAGRLQLGRFPAYAQAISMPADHVDLFMEYVDRFYLGSGDPVFYIRGTGEVRNNRISMNLQRVELGRLPIPGGFLRTYNNFIADYASDRLASVPHHSIESLRFEAGQMLFQGTVPDEIPAY